jgi:hypothetical protein
MTVNELIKVLQNIKEKGFGERLVFIENTADDYYETINAIGNYPENECLFCTDPDVSGYAKVYPGSKFFNDYLLDESELNGIIIA